jgi:hypothetical protein
MLYAARALGWRWEQMRVPFGHADDVLTAILVITLIALWLRARRTARETRA